METLMRIFKYLSIFSLVILFATCVNDSTERESVQFVMVDHNAGEYTINLYKNLHNYAGAGLMFGHQATLDYGYTWHSSEIPADSLRSDVKDVSGSFPAVFGWDVNYVANPQFDDSTRKARVSLQLKRDRGVFERGGILTYEWHMYHPGTGRSFYDTTAVVHRIIPGGDLHEVLKKNLDNAAEYFRELAPVPVIFRPWHEHNGDWFWWCRGSTNEADFIALWRFTIEYFRDVHGLDNLIYAYSPDRSRINIYDFETGYLWGYPGDDYVDIIGLDNYWDLGHPVNETPPEIQLVHFRKSLEYTVDFANSRGKVAALTETGLEGIPNPTWWTDVILSSVLHNEKTRQISYFLVWRNATYQRDRKDHYYAPFPGQVSAPNFQEFHAHPFVWLENDLPQMYAADSHQIQK
jgi:mannan endo-1,4-beta-mannosidase